ncbi:MAG: TIGR03013 family PEP-CTERM/XrtA system glycosyltransferase [Gammaproteobacteria bacterium]
MATIRLFKHYLKVPFLLIGALETFIFVLALELTIRLAPIFPYFVVSPQLAESPVLHEVIFALSMLLGMIAIGLYQTRLRDGFAGILLRVVTSFLLGTIILSVIFYALEDIFIGRGAMTAAIIISFWGVVIVRWIVYTFEPEIFKRRILILGAGKKAKVITELRRKVDQFGFTILGFVHLRGETDSVPKERVINLNMPLIEYVEQHGVDEIVLAIDDRRKGIPMAELLECKMRGIDIIDLITFFERETGKIRLDQLHPSWLLFSVGFNQGGLRATVKRGFDLLMSSVLLFFTWPIMLLAAFAIWLESGFKIGVPIFYKQVRVGEAGRPFQVLKFRSMIVNAEKSGKAQWATSNDTRITRVGRVIRKTRIDELPQIFNVFRGDMSFVGPRPERPEFVVMLAEKIPYYAERHRVKPGITGWAQLLYPYGSSEKDALEKLQYDLYYIKNYSIFLDFLIMLQTTEVVLFSRGAR